MDPARRNALITEHIDSLSRRSGAETGSLTQRLHGGCWPGDAGDSSQPAALEWLRRWRPSRSSLPAANCTCPQGYCAVCN